MPLQKGVGSGSRGKCFPDPQVTQGPWSDRKLAEPQGPTATRHSAMPSTALKQQGRQEAEFFTSTHLGGSTLQRSTDPETTENKAWGYQANSCIGISVKTPVCPHHEAWEVQAASGRAGWTHPIPATPGHGAGETPCEAGTGASAIRLHLCS